MIVIYKYSLVAQSVEQVTVNHWVGGSNPSQGANFRPTLIFLNFLVHYRNDYVHAKVGLITFCKARILYAYS